MILNWFISNPISHVSLKLSLLLLFSLSCLLILLFYYNYVTNTNAVFVLFLLLANSKAIRILKFILQDCQRPVFHFKTKGPFTLAICKELGSKYGQNLHKYSFLLNVADIYEFEYSPRTCESHFMWTSFIKNISPPTSP